MNFTTAKHHLGSLLWAAVFYGILAGGWFLVSENAINKLEGHHDHKESNQ